MHAFGPYSRWLVLTVVTLGNAVSAHAQSRPYFGGAVTFVTQTRSTNLQPGGTTWGGSVLFGVPLSPRLSVEFEPLFVGSLAEQYTYSPTPSTSARVITRRRDTFFTFQVRARTGFLEPVVGVSYVRGAASRQATLIDPPSPYFDDRQSQHALAVMGGIDAAVRLTSHVFFVPTFRTFVVARPSPEGPIGQQTRGGRFAFQYGAGVRVVF